MRLPILLALGFALAMPVSAAQRLADMLPGKAVLDAAARAVFDEPAPSGVTYTGEARVGFPVLPLQVFGIHYAVDIVLVSTHPDWDMHEYARIDLPGRSLWLAKDANQDRVQTIVSDLPDLAGWAPEVPIERVEGPLVVDDRSEGRQIDVRLQYTNPAGDAVDVSYMGKMPRRPPAKRSGSTMGHSRGIVAVVLDLARFGHGGKAKIRIGGKPYGLDHLLGVYPQKYLLDQTQGGVAVARFRQSPTESGFRLERPDPDDPRPWPTHADEAWTVRTEGDQQWATMDNGVTAQTYRFRDGEWLGAEVHQAGEAEPIFTFALDRALPDLRRRFEGTATSRFSMDVHGQRGHGTGLLRARWQGDRAVVELVPTAPRWLVDRPMRGEIGYSEDGAAHVVVERAELSP